MTVAAVQIARDKVPAYQYLTPDVPEMIALGLNSPIVIAEQLVINDRLRPDRYFLKTITGLRGGDIRDTRVPHPAAHGEIPYDSFWSGRTITMEGTIEAGNISQLNRMERDLMAVLGPLPAAALGSYYSQSIAAEYLTALQALPEFPVKFNWWDQHDGFYDSQNVAFWGTLSGSPLVIPGTGRATTQGGGSTLSYYNLRGGYVDEVVTAMIAVNPMALATTIGVTACCNADNSYLTGLLAWDGVSSATIGIDAVTPTGVVALASAGVPGSLTAKFMWLRLRTLADEVDLDLFDVDPRSNQSATPVASCSTVLTGGLAQQFGYGRPGFAGVIATSTSNGWCFLDWRVDSIYPCDFQLGGRMIQSPSMGHVKQDVGTTVFRKDFQFSIRASDPRILCPTTVTKTVPVAFSGSGPIAIGMIFPMTFPIVFETPLSEPTGAPLSQSPTVGSKIVAVNNGTWIAKPIITIYGGITNPILTNLSNGQRLILDGTIADGDFVIVDCLQFKLTNKAGANVFGLWDASSSWVTLQPGDNALTLTGLSVSGSPTATVRFASAWI